MKESFFRTLPEFEKRTNLSFWIERVLNKINEHEIEKILKTLKGSKSMGPDLIHPTIKKECASEFAILSFFGNQLSKEKSPTHGDMQILALYSRKDTESFAPTIDQYP